METLLKDGVAALMSIIAVVVLSYLAVVVESETAVGAIIAVSAAATAWYLRGRVQTPNP